MYQHAKTEISASKRKNTNAAAALQESFGSNQNEMSKIGNYAIQIFNFRSQTKQRLFHNLVTSIIAEELDHVESRDDALENSLIPD